MEAERGVTQLMACQIALKHVGEDMTAQVMGVHPAGAFVRPVELFVDGLVPMEALSHHYRGYFEYVEDDQMLFSRRTKTKIQLGERLEVQLTGVNMKRRQIDFAIAEQGKERFKSKKQMGWRRDRDEERQVKAKLRRPPEEAPGERRRGRAEERRPQREERGPEPQERHSDSLRRVREATRVEHRAPPPAPKVPVDRPAAEPPARPRPRSWEEQYLAPPAEPVRPKRWEEMRERIGQRDNERERPRPGRYGMTDVSDPYASRSSQKAGRKTDSAPADGRPPRRNKRASGGRPSGRPGGRGPRGRR